MCVCVCARAFVRACNFSLRLMFVGEVIWFGGFMICMFSGDLVEVVFEFENLHVCNFAPMRAVCSAYTCKCVCVLVCVCVRVCVCVCASAFAD